MAGRNPKPMENAAGARGKTGYPRRDEVMIDPRAPNAPSPGVGSRLSASRSLSRVNSVRSSLEELWARSKATANKGLKKMGSASNLKSENVSGAPSTGASSAGLPSPSFPNAGQGISGPPSPLRACENFDEKTQKKIVRTLHRVANSQEVDFNDADSDEFWYVKLFFDNGRDSQDLDVKVALLDTGASFDTISEEYAEQLQLKVGKCTRVTAKAANGSDMEVLGHVRCDVFWQETERDFVGLLRFLVVRGQVRPVHISKRSSERLGFLVRNPNLLAIEIRKNPEAEEEDRRAYELKKEATRRAEGAKARENELAPEELSKHLRAVQQQQQASAGNKGPSFKQRVSNAATNIFRGFPDS